MNKNNLDLFMGQFTIRETLLLTPFRINIYRCFNRFWFQSSHDPIPGFSKTNGKSSLETEKIDGLVWRFLGFCSRFVGLRWCNRQGIWLTGKHVLTKHSTQGGAPTLMFVVSEATPLNFWYIYISIMHPTYPIHPILIPLSQVGGTMFVTCCPYSPW